VGSHLLVRTGEAWGSGHVPPSLYPVQWVWRSGNGAVSGSPLNWAERWAEHFVAPLYQYGLVIRHNANLAAAHILSHKFTRVTTREAYLALYKSFILADKSSKATRLTGCAWYWRCSSHGLQVLVNFNRTTFVGRLLMTPRLPFLSAFAVTQYLLDLSSPTSPCRLCFSGQKTYIMFVYADALKQQNYYFCNFRAFHAYNLWKNSIFRTWSAPP